MTLEPHKRDIETLRGYWETEEELKRAYALKGGEEELKRQQIDWQEAKRKYQRIMVLADPGMGKSMLLQMEVGITAQREFQRLQENETTIDQLILPLFLRLSELAKRSEELIEAIPLLIQRNYPNTAPALLRFLAEKLKAGKCLLLLDALDEVPKIDRNRTELKEKVDRFASNYPCPIICTSRIVGYDSSFLTGGKEVEIVPFREQQIEQYVVTWFTNAADHISDESVSASALMRELRSKPQVLGLVQNPLLLSLICSLYQEKGLTLPARRVQVYEKAVEYMLGKWNQTRQSLFPGKTRAKIRLLEALAYHFSCKDQEVFNLDDLYNWMEGYLDEQAPRDLKDAGTEALIAEFSEEDGILQKLNPNDDQYLFLHRTFQEYLTACYLVQAKDELDLARQNLWKYDWHETISLLTGLSQDPIPLLKTIISEKDDIFHSLLLLAGQCVVECENNSHPLIDEICERIYKLWYSHPSITFFGLTVRLLARSNKWILNKLLYESLNDSSNEIRFRSAQIMGEIATPKMTSTLIEAFENGNSYVKIWIILALGRIGTRKTINFLIAALDEDDANVRRWTLNILGKLNRLDTIHLLIEKLCPPDRHAVNEILTALREAIDYCDEIFQEEDSVPDKETIILILLDGFQFLHTLNRRLIITLLGNIGDFSVSKKLINVLQPLENSIEKWLASALEEVEQQDVSVLIQGLNLNQDTCITSITASLASLIAEDLHIYCSEIRREAVIALGKIGDPQAVQALSQAFDDIDSDVRGEATTALGKIGNLQAIEVLVQVVNDPNSHVRRQAVTALGNIKNNSQVLELLTQILYDSHFDVRWRAAAALGNIGNSQAVESLISSLDHPDDDVRREAFAALGEVSNFIAVTTLIDFLNRETNSKDRKWISAAIGRVKWTTESLKGLRNGQVLEDLIQALADSDAYVVRWIVIALGKLRHPKAVDPLISTLKHHNRDVRKHAAVALGKLRHPKAVDPLISTLRDRSNEVREQAVVALERIGDSRAVLPLIEILSLSDDRSNFLLSRLLKRILWKKSKIIQSVNSSNSSDSSIRCRAATALGELRDSRAVKVLARALTDSSSDVRERATVALGQIGGLQALKVLVQALSHSDRGVKKESVEALKRIGTRKALTRILESPYIDPYEPDISSLIRTLTIQINANSQENKPIIIYHIRGIKMRLILRWLTLSK